MYCIHFWVIVKWNFYEANKGIFSCMNLLWIRDGIFYLLWTGKKQFTVNSMKKTSFKCCELWKQIVTINCDLHHVVHELDRKIREYGHSQKNACERCGFEEPVKQIFLSKQEEIHYILQISPASISLWSHYFLPHWSRKPLHFSH